ncbi:DUF1614 domain-containing protein [Metallumcola ferriviriculae]|uniref:DUF1614 domain-containing protein n=1 Tax=Metallumcola ferriviriculae TaxID=3039180 RepID=A0AAU0UQA8_9FIRM|nr:DUF1614 domain-containing protein [Desulfitibacteraceae bacterium MK1]
MAGFPIGMIALLGVSILIYFGLAHRILDRLRLTDKAALAVIAAMIIGSFIDIPLTTGAVDASINVGGGVIPVLLALYVLFRAGTTKEWVRAIGAAAATALGIWFIGSRLMTGDPGARFDVLDPLWVYPIVGGGIAYLLGRSRRASFIAATLGVLSLDVINYFWLASRGIGGTVAIGGAGAFDAIVLAGLIAVLLAEIVGESRERLQGGPATKGRPKELLQGLKKPGLEAGEEMHPDTELKGETIEDKDQLEEEDSERGGDRE